VLPELFEQGLEQGISAVLLVLGIGRGHQAEGLLDELLGQGEGGAGHGVNKRELESSTATP